MNLKHLLFPFITLVTVCAVYINTAPAQSYNVTFNVDMTDATGFNPATDDVYISGSMAGWPMPGTNPDLQMQPSQPGSMIYTLTLNLSTGVYEYKYFRVINNTPSWDHGEWPGGLNRSVDVVNHLVLNDVWGVYSTDPVIFWANLQWPPNGDIFLGNSFDVYAQVYIPGETGQSTPAAGVQAWIGYHTADTDPSTWNTWIVADYQAPSGNNDEYMADIGITINTPGTYYYASRFQLNNDDFVYGGYSDEGGSFWDGTDYVSGVLTVTEDIPDPEITWANLQWPPDGTITIGNPYDVFAQVHLPGYSGQGTPVAGVQAWIGYHTGNTDPQTWSNWIIAAFNESSGNNDEYMAEIGSFIPETGIYYYASRFQLDDGAYVYGGYSDEGGGFWDGTANISGILTVEDLPEPEITWANLEYPPNGYISIGSTFNVYAQVYIESITGQGTPAPGVEAWIGYGSENVHPSLWNNWVEADFNIAVNNNDEYMANIGTQITSPGTYYYASRFKYNDDAYVYGGYSPEGGGFWDGLDYVSGELLVEDVPVFILDLVVNPANSGSTTGEGLYPEGAEVMVSANPAPGFQFVNWTENGVVVSTNNPYIFTMPAGNMELTANFELIPPPQVTFNVDMSDADPFNPESDDVYISGTLNEWTVPGTDSAYLLLPSETGSMIYTITMELEAGSYEYKYFRVINGLPGFDNGEWPEDIYRLISFANDTIVNDEWGVYPNVGITERGKALFNIYPNPSCGSFYIKSEDQASEIKTINIRSINGLLKQSFKPASSKLLYIQIVNAAKGVYLLEIVTKETRLVRKIVVM